MLTTSPTEKKSKDWALGLISDRIAFLSKTEFAKKLVLVRISRVEVYEIQNIPQSTSTSGIVETSSHSNINAVDGT